MHKVELKNVPIGDLKPYGNNPRKNALAVDRVAKSLLEFGLIKNSIVVDEDMNLICGHTTLLAIKKLKWDAVPEVTQVFDLTEDEIRAYRIVDNRTGEFSEWDLDALVMEITALQDAGLSADITGFSQNDIDALIRGVSNDLETIDAQNERDDKDDSEHIPRQLVKETQGNTYLTIGVITVQIQPEVYEMFRETCESQSDIKSFVNEVLRNASYGPD